MYLAFQGLRLHFTLNPFLSHPYWWRWWWAPSNDLYVSTCTYGITVRHHIRRLASSTKRNLSIPELHSNDLQFLRMMLFFFTISVVPLQTTAVTYIFIVPLVLKVRSVFMRIDGLYCAPVDKNTICVSSDIDWSSSSVIESKASQFAFFDSFGSSKVDDKGFLFETDAVLPSRHCTYTALLAKPTHTGPLLNAPR